MSHHMGTIVARRAEAARRKLVDMRDKEKAIFSEVDGLAAKFHVDDVDEGPKQVRSAAATLRMGHLSEQDRTAVMKGDGSSYARKHAGFEKGDHGGELGALLQQRRKDFHIVDGSDVLAQRGGEEVPIGDDEDQEAGGVADLIGDLFSNLSSTRHDLRKRTRAKCSHQADKSAHADADEAQSVEERANAAAAQKRSTKELQRQEDEETSAIAEGKKREDKEKIEKRQQEDDPWPLPEARQMRHRFREPNAVVKPKARRRMGGFGAGRKRQQQQQQAALDAGGDAAHSEGEWRCLTCGNLNEATKSKRSGRQAAVGGAGDVLVQECAVCGHSTRGQTARLQRALQRAKKAEEAYVRGREHQEEEALQDWLAFSESMSDVKAESPKRRGKTRTKGKARHGEKNKNVFSTSS